MRFEGTSTRDPVLGLRPTRGCRWRVRKLPNPRISTLSLLCRLFTMLSKMVSTIVSESLRVISTTFDTSSISSALVIAALLSLLIPVFPFVLFNRMAHCGGCRRRLLLVLLQPVPFVVIGNGALAQSNPFLRFVHFDDFKFKLLAYRQRRFLAPCLTRATSAARLGGNFAPMAKPLHARQ